MVREPNPPGDRSFFVVSDRVSDRPAPAHLALRARYLAKAEGSSSSQRTIRLGALAALGVAIGAGSAVLGVSFVQASDRVDMYAVLQRDGAARREPVLPAAVSSYAPAGRAIHQPLGVVNGRGMVAFPSFELNPFHPRDAARAARTGKPRSNARAGASETVSGAADVARSICVRLCDGYQYPLAHLRDGGDLRGHEALCAATFPGVPTRVFRVAAGADGIDGAVSRDGKTYASLPMAYAYQTSIDPACARPRTGGQDIAVMRDFTLRPGDAVVINGRPKVFNGASSFPYTAANFRDFRSAPTISNTTRKQMDEIVGVSRQERLQREARRMARVREANAGARDTAIDVVSGGASRSSPGVRVIELPRR
jgi:hypothetical protein